MAAQLLATLPARQAQACGLDVEHPVAISPASAGQRRTTSSHDVRAVRGAVASIWRKSASVIRASRSASRYVRPLCSTSAGSTCVGDGPSTDALTTRSCGGNGMTVLVTELVSFLVRAASALLGRARG